jgi:hypothetical protein
MTLTSGANVEVTFDSRPQNDRSESSVAANPTDPQNLVGASKKFTDPTTYQFSLAAVYSIDGGQTWSPGDNLQPVPPILDEKIDGTSDPVVVFDDQGRAYLLGLAFKYQGAKTLALLMGMVVYTSGGPGQKAGQHWSKPTIIHEAPDRNDDKGAMASDLGQNSKNKGNVYVAWDGTDRNGNGGVLFARTTDHGQVWNGVSTDPPGTLIIPDADFSAVTVGSSGRVYVFAGTQAEIVYVVSEDGGVSFSNPQVAVTGVTSLPGSLPGGTFRVITIASACPDGAGGVLVAWADHRDGVARIYCRRSADGINWDGPQDGQPLLDSTVGSPADHHDFHPQLALAPDGSIGCSFYEFGPTPTANLINTVLARSTDNGHTFTERVTVTDKPWDPTVDAVTDENGATFIGDYFGLAANSLGFFPLWTDTRTGIQELFTARVRETLMSLVVSEFDHQQHFTYIERDGTLQDVWFSTDRGWNLQQLTQKPAAITGEFVITSKPDAGPPPAAGSPLVVSEFDHQQHFTYIERGGTLQDVWFSTDRGWNLQQLTQPINNGKPAIPGEFVIPTPGPTPAAGSPLVVSIFNDQQHFTYIDRGGRIQDVWFSTGRGWNLQQLTQKPAAITGEFVITSKPDAGPPEW